MYSLSQLRRRVDALQRKLALPLAVVRLRPLAEDFINEWDVARFDKKPLPETHPFILRIAQHGFRFNTFMALHHYLEGCRSGNTIPHCYGIIAALLPQLPIDRLEQMLRWDSPGREPLYPELFGGRPLLVQPSLS